MEKRKEKNGPTHVPQYGGWDNKAAAGGNSDYAMPRANKQHHHHHHHHHKNGLGAHHGLGNDQQFPGKKQEDPCMNNGYRSVPQFGMWDQQAAGSEGGGNYTVVFTQARANRKQHKNNDLLARPPSIDHEQEALRKQHEDACMRKKGMLTYLCCIRP